MRALALWFLRTYKRWLSPMLPVSCRYVPTCSEYALEAVEKFGAIHGGLIAVGRLLRCHPFVKGGYDPVPDRVGWKHRRADCGGGAQPLKGL